MLSAAAVCTLSFSVSNPASAQTEMERAGAREAAKQGAQAFEQKRWAEAIDLFTRAESLVHAPPHLLHIARASANLGQLVKARETYLKITREKLDASSPKAFRDAQASAGKELAALEPRLPLVKATVTGGEGKTVKVTMDDQEMAPALVGLTIPVDPGEHKFKATTSDGLASKEAKLTLKEGAKETVALALEAPAAGAAPAAPPTPAGPAAPAVPAASPPAAASLAEPATPAPAAETGSANGMRIASYVAAGVGLIGLGVGTAFAFKAKSKSDDGNALYAKNHCPSCTPALKQEIQDLDSQHNSAKTLATVGFVVGGVGIAAGVTMFILSSGSDTPAAPPKAAWVAPWLGPGAVGLSGGF